MKTWLTNRIFKIFEQDGLLETTDFDEAETALIETSLAGREKKRNIFVSLFASSIVGASTVSLLRCTSLQQCKYIFGAVSSTILGGFGVSLIALTCFEKNVREMKLMLKSFSNVRSAEKQRRTVCFSLSLKESNVNGLNVLCYRNQVDVIMKCAKSADSLNKGILNPEPLWNQIYTEEIKELVNICDETVIRQRFHTNEDLIVAIETLFDLIRLHISEYCRLVIIRLCQSDGALSFLSTIRSFNHLMSYCRRIRENNNELVKSLAIRKVKKKKNILETKNQMNQMDKVVIGLEAVLDSIENGSIDHNGVEIALKRCLAIITERSIQEEGKEENNSDRHNSEITREIENVAGEPIVYDGNYAEEPTDMMFEGVTLTEEEKEKKRKEVSYNFLLEGSMNHKNSSNLFGELAMVLEPRRNDFERREKAALAKFYGIDEDQLEDFVKNVNQNEKAESDDEVDWEQPKGQGIGEDMDFLEALKQRQIQQVHIGDDEDD